MLACKALKSMLCGRLHGVQDKTEEGRTALSQDAWPSA